MANANDSVNALPTINLLPYHAERRADKRKKVFMSLGPLRSRVPWRCCWAAW